MSIHTAISVFTAFRVRVTRALRQLGLASSRLASRLGRPKEMTWSSVRVAIEISLRFNIVAKFLRAAVSTRINPGTGNAKVQQDALISTRENQHDIVQFPADAAKRVTRARRRRCSANPPQSAGVRRAGGNRRRVIGGFTPVT